MFNFHVKTRGFWQFRDVINPNITNKILAKILANSSQRPHLHIINIWNELDDNKCSIPMLKVEDSDQFRDVINPNFTNTILAKNLANSSQVSHLHIINIWNELDDNKGSIPMLKVVDSDQFRDVINPNITNTILAKKTSQIAVKYPVYTW